jgi:hypothetical protein
MVGKAQLPAPLPALREPTAVRLSAGSWKLEAGSWKLVAELNRQTTVEHSSRWQVVRDFDAAAVSAMMRRTIASRGRAAALVDSAWRKLSRSAAGMPGPLSASRGATR